MAVAPKLITDLDYMLRSSPVVDRRDHYQSNSRVGLIRDRDPLHLSHSSSLSDDNEYIDDDGYGSFYIPGITHRARCLCSPRTSLLPERRSARPDKAGPVNRGVFRQASCRSEPPQHERRLPINRRRHLLEDMSASMSKLDSLRTERVSHEKMNKSDSRLLAMEDIQNDFKKLEHRQRIMRKKQKHALELRKMQR